MQKDFWGKTKRNKAESWENGLRQYDASSFSDRLKRLRLLAEAMASPNGYLFHGLESVLLFEDAKNCFVFGQFAACILVCQALLEHHLKGPYRMAGKDSVVQMSFKKFIEYALADNTLPDFLISKLDELRKKRNPLVHPSKDALDSYIPKALPLNTTPEELLEQDAKDAILLTFEVLHRRPFG